MGLAYILTDVPAFAAGLFCACFFAALTGSAVPEWRGQLWRVGTVLALNWSSGMAYVWFSGDYTPWQFSIIIDTLSAAAILWHPAGKAQMYIGLFYLVQIAGHIAYGIRLITDMAASANYYYEAITWVAWAQLVAVGVWCGGLWLQAGLHHWRDRRDASDSRALARDGEK